MPSLRAPISLWSEQDRFVMMSRPTRHPLPSLVYFDERLASHPYTGFKAGARLPIGLDAVRHGNFAVTIGGKRYGKGSSREHSPVAERAGRHPACHRRELRAHLPPERRQCRPVSTSTDFGLIERIQGGEAIDIEELVGDRDTIAAAVLRSGGLLLYGQERLRSVSRLRPNPLTGRVRAPCSRRSCPAAWCRRLTA